MKKIIYLTTLLLWVAYTEPLKEIANEELVPELKLLIELKPITKEQIKNSIYSGIYGINAPEDADFIEYGSENLFIDLQKTRQAFLNKDIEIVKNIRTYNPLRDFFKIKYKCSQHYFAQKKSEDFQKIIDCIKSSRHQHEQMVVNNQLYLYRYQQIQDLELGDVINYFSVSSRLNSIMELSYLRIIQAFYLMEDGFSQEALDILNKEKNFFVKLGKNQNHSFHLYRYLDIYTSISRLQGMLAIFLDYQDAYKHQNNKNIEDFLQSFDQNFHPIFHAKDYSENKYTILNHYYLNNGLNHNWSLIIGNLNKTNFLNELFNINSACVKPISKMTIDEYYNFYIKNKQYGIVNCYSLETINEESKKQLDDYIKLGFYFDAKTYIDLFKINVLLKIKFQAIKNFNKKEINSYLKDISQGKYREFNIFLPFIYTWNEDEKVLSTISSVCIKNIENCSKNNLINVYIGR